MSKYEPLWQYIQKSDAQSLQLTFAEIGEILGFAIDHSFLAHKKRIGGFSA